MAFDVKRCIVRALLSAIFPIGIFACGGGSPGPAVLSVGGTYQTQVTLLAGNTCVPAPTVQDNPTTVVHTPGASSLSLTHANITYQGTIDNSAAFATTPNMFSLGGSQYNITIGGQFNRTGFDATVNVSVTQPTPACAYMLHWVGTKSGPPNTIP
jgi:hypothetical protein